MNYRIANKILSCKSTLHKDIKRILRAREKLLKNPNRMNKDRILLVPIERK